MYLQRDPRELCVPIYRHSGTDWMRAVVRHAEIYGYAAERVKSGVVVWKANKICQIPKGIEFVEAIEVNKEYLGEAKRGCCIGLTSKRLYFKNGSKTPSRERENMLLGFTPKPPKNLANILKHLCDFGNGLVGSGEFQHLSGVQHDDTNIIELTSAEGACSVFPLAQDMCNPAIKSGWQVVPEQVKVHFLADDTHTDAVKFFKDYKVKIKETWTRFSKYSSNFEVKGWNLSSFLDRARLTKIKPEIFSDTDIVVLAVTGKQGEPLPAMHSELMSIMDSWRQQYRLVSLTTTKHSDHWFSPHALSILNAVGTPYSLKLPFPENFNKGAIFGLDVGHDHKNRLSNIVVTVSSPGGRLIASALRSGLRIDESISGNLVKGLLREARLLAEQRQGEKFDRAIIFRDGRLPNNNAQKTLEITENYVDALGIPTSLIELRKNNNPPIIKNGQTGIAIGACFRPGVENIRYATFYESKLGMAKTFKIVIPKGGDVLGWGADAYVNILCGLCYAPSLGSQPHLPGPIYWADGFAKTSSVDNKFRGYNT